MTYLREFQSSRLIWKHGELACLLSIWCFHGGYFPLPTRRLTDQRPFDNLASFRPVVMLRAAQSQLISHSPGGILDEDRAPLFAGMLGTTATARALLAFQLQPNYFFRMLTLHDRGEFKGLPMTGRLMKSWLIFAVPVFHVFPILPAFGLPAFGALVEPC